MPVSNIVSEWIAHGIIDSIVDAFFPLLKAIEKEVTEVEDLVAGQEEPEPPTKAPTSPTTPEEPSSPDSQPFVKEKLESSQESDSISIRSFASTIRKRSFDPRTWIPWLTPRERAKPVESQTLRTLLRMTSTRRLVTTLTRLLSSKSEVVGQFRKRLKMQSTVGIDAGVEVEIYMGDVHDHILTLQQSLAHYERILSHSHPAYLSHLRFTMSEAKAGQETALLGLSALGLIVLAMQVITGESFGGRLCTDTRANC